MIEKDIEETNRNITETYGYNYLDKFSIEDNIGRRVYLNCEVDETIVDDIVYHILRYNRMDKGIPTNERKPIILYINSLGGTVAEGYSLIDTILLSKTPVYTVNLASAASMAFLIFIAGHKRYSLPHSEFLIHDGSIMGHDSISKMRDRMEFETIELEKITKQYILSHTKITENLYNDKYRCDWYFLPYKAKEIGAVDYIVGEDCDIDDII